METGKTFLPVNWIDGMKISRSHFIQTDYHTLDLVRDTLAFSLNDLNFGLTGEYIHTEPNFDLSVTEIAGNTLELHLKSCQAVTRGGARIHIHAKNSLKATINAADTQHQDQVFEVILSVNPFERIPSGIPDIEENPPRHPFTESKYNLDIVPAGQVNERYLGPYYLVAGIIRKRSGSLLYDHSYIPASTTIISHPVTIKLFEDYGQSLQNLYNYSLKIIRKIYEKNKPSSVAKNLRFICERILEYNSIHYFRIRNILPYQAPVYLVETYSVLAYTLHNALHSISGEEREEVFKYIYEWCDITPGDFDEMLTGTYKIRYNHLSLAESLEPIGKFLKMLEGIWSKLDSLEFIGQRKENIVVTKEVVVQQTELPKKRWSILD